MKAVQDSERIFVNPTDRPKVAGGARRASSPTIPYGLEEFLADRNFVLDEKWRLNVFRRAG